MTGVSTEAKAWPVSPAQKRLWVVSQMLEGASASAYNMPVALRLTGPLNVDALQHALEFLMARHEALRTTFSVVGDEPYQLVHADPLTRPQFLDVSGCPDPQLRARELAAENAAAAFDLATGPLVRVSLLRLAPLDHVLLFNVHHIVFDEWSMGVLVGELNEAYSGFSCGRAISVPELRIQYKDFAGWQNKLMQRDAVLAQRDYWHTRLSGPLPALDLPADFPRPASKSYAAGAIEVQLEQAVFSGLTRLAAANRTTLFTCLVAAVKVLLFRYTGEEDITVGCPVAGRDHPSLANQVGFYVNTLALRDRVRAQDSFSDLLLEVKTTVTEALENQSYPFDRLVSELKLERDVTRSPLFDVSVNLNPAGVHGGGLSLSGLTAAVFEQAFARAKVDLSFDFSETGAGLHLTLIYSSALFKPERVENMARHFQQLIASCIQKPDVAVGLLELMTRAEKHRILEEFNNNVQPFADDRTIVDVFQDQVRNTPELTAIRFNSDTLTYEELNRRANQLARYLQSRGVGPEVPVGVCLERSPSLIVAFLAIMKAGGAYLPLEPTLPLQRLSTIITDSFLPIVLTETSVEDNLPSFMGTTLTLDVEQNDISIESGENPPRCAGPDNTAYIIYTSGSTGKPKGVIVAHRGLFNLSEVQKSLFQVQPGDRALQFASASFDASVFEITQALCRGAALCMGSREDLMPGEPLLRFLSGERINIVTLPPSALAMLPAGELSELRTITVAGEACTPELVQRWSSARLFFNLYGPTEATIWSTQALYHSAAAEVSIGKPIPNVRIYILDARLQPVPVGVPGEIFIGGAGVARGYLYQPRGTAERFLPDPFGTALGARMYRTGDIARCLSDGSIEFLGRVDDQVKIRGHRVELGEIEAMLVSHPHVRNAAVVFRSDQSGSKRILAYITSDQKNFEVQELRSWLRTRLPDYMMPSDISLLSELPITPSGKVDRKNLPDPGVLCTSATSELVGPRSDLEAVLVRIFAEVLRRERVGVTESFFDIGGHSLLATQVASRIREALRVEVPLARIFQNSTAADLATALRAIEPDKVDRIAKVIERLRNMPEEEKQKLRTRNAPQP